MRDRLLEQVKRKVAEGEIPDSFTISKQDISTVLKVLQMMALSPELFWQIQQAEIIELESIREAIPSSRDRCRAKQNTGTGYCYYNAVKVCRKLRANYCEGWVVSPRMGVLNHHAWNRLNGHFFDVTGEQFIEDLLPDRLYVLGFET